MCFTHIRTFLILGIIFLFIFKMESGPDHRSDLLRKDIGSCISSKPPYKLNIYNRCIFFIEIFP